MKKKSPSQSAFLNLRVLIGLAVFLSGICLALAGLGAFSNAPHQSTRPAERSGGKSPPATNIEYSPADKAGRFVYLIEFTEPGMLRRQARARGERFNPNAPQAQTQRDQISREQTNHVQTIAKALGRALNVTHHFLVTHSGIATRLTPEEAQVVRTLPGVRSVERERLYHVTTFRGPTFIGADHIWDGTGVPNGQGTRGEGVIIAMLDTGIDPNHPSFANAASCGHGTTQPNKLISFLDCSSTAPNGLCNGPDPTDSNGHGTHTSSTAGGNTLGPSASPPPVPPPPFTEISGVAPCASIRAYKVCPTNQCPEADIQAGMNSVLIHGDADVMNFSISGGEDPWVDNDRRKLDLVDAGVLVAASAGNTSAGVPDPVGQVNHLGPWVFTVAASTRDGEFSGLLSVAGPGVPPPNLQDISIDRGSDSPLGDPLTNHPIRHFTGQPSTAEGCTASPPFPAGFFTGSVALIHRGGCTFTEKITNAFNAGADMVVIRNNQPGGLLMLTTGQPNVPAYSIGSQATGNDLNAFVDANPATATVNFELVEVPGDVLADFSLRGPTQPPFQNLTKPDITGPGVNIYAAVPLSLGAYGVLSGTSMSSPHAAGSAALVRKVHPDWAVSEVKSALMMTAFENGTKEDETTPWNADDVGSGRLDLTKAALAGLVMNETTANYLAANPATGGDPKTLNLASVRNVNCTPNCTWTRTVRNTRAMPTSWTASGVASAPGMQITISPANFAFNGGMGETQQLTITAAPAFGGGLAFGKVVLSPAGGVSPDQHITVAIQGRHQPTPGPSGTPRATPPPRP